MQPDVFSICNTADDDVEMTANNAELLAGLASEAQKLSTHAETGTQTEMSGGTGTLKMLLCVADSEYGATQVEHIDECSDSACQVEEVKKPCSSQVHEDSQRGILNVTPVLAML